MQQAHLKILMVPVFVLLQTIEPIVFLVKGDPETRKRIRHMIEMLDAFGRPFRWFKKFSIEICKCKNLSEILQGLVTGQAVSSSNSNNSSSNSSNPINNLMGNNQNSSSNTSGSNGSSISTPSINLNGNSNNNNQNSISSFSQNGVSIIADNAQNSLVVKADPQCAKLNLLFSSLMFVVSKF